MKKRLRIAKHMHEILSLAARRADAREGGVDLIEIIIDGEDAKQAVRDLIVNGLLELLEPPSRLLVITDSGRAILTDWDKPGHGRKGEL